MSSSSSENGKYERERYKKRRERRDKENSEKYRRNDEEDKYTNKRSEGGEGSNKQKDEYTSTEQYERNNYKKESEEAYERLKKYLNEKDFEILKTYSLDDLCLYILIQSKINGNTVMLFINSKYNIKNLSNTIRLNNYDQGKNLDQQILFESESNLNFINNDYYKPIDLSLEKSKKINYLLSVNKRQLERLKSCTENIHYKICIETESYFMIINKKNEIDIYSLENIGKNKNIYFVLDLEYFYEKYDNLNLDLNMISKSLYTILDKTHKKQIQLITNHIKDLSSIKNKLEVRFEKRKEYVIVIEKLNSNIKQLEDEKEILNGKINRNIHKDGLIKLEFQLEKIKELHKNTTEALLYVKNEYTNFILDFDYILSDNLKMFEQIHKNFRLIENN
jgi:hypothetical protein